MDYRCPKCANEMRKRVMVTGTDQSTEVWYCDRCNHSYTPEEIDKIVFRE